MLVIFLEVPSPERQNGVFPVVGQHVVVDKPFLDQLTWLALKCINYQAATHEAMLGQILLVDA